MYQNGSIQDTNNQDVTTSMSEKQQPATVFQPEGNGGPDNSHLPESKDGLPTYSQALAYSRQAPQVHIHIERVAKKGCLTWRNCAMTMSLLKIVWAIIHIGLLSYTLQYTTPLWMKEENLNVQEDSKTETKMAPIKHFVFFIMTSITLQCIIMAVSMLGFYAALKRSTSLVLASALVSIISDALPIILSLTVASISRLSTMEIVGSALEAVFFCVMICYYRYLKKKKTLSRAPVEEQTLSRLVTDFDAFTPRPTLQIRN